MVTQPRPSAEIKQQLAEFRDVRQSAETYGTPDFASLMSLRSLKRQETLLQEELRAAQMVESVYDAEVIVSGQPVENHRIRVDFFGKFLVLAQNLIDELATGQTKDQMLLAAVAPSSFKASFTLAADESQQRLLDVPVTSGADVLCEILDGKATSEQITYALDSQRAKSYYAQLMKLLVKQGAIIQLRTKTMPYGSVLSPQQASERSEWLNELRVKTEVIEVDGILKGADLSTLAFRLEVDNGFLTGRATDDAAVQIRRITLDTGVRATLEKTTKTHIEMPFPIVKYSLRHVASNDASRDEQSVLNV
jgi:hypothetical protein